MRIDPKYLVLGGTAVGSLAVGGFVGYRVAAKRYINYFDQTLEKELEGTITFLEGRINTLETIVQAYENPPEDLEDVTDVTESPLAERANAAHIQYNRMNKTTPKEVAEAIKTLESIGQDEEPEGVEVAVVEVTETNVFEMEGVDEDPLDRANRNPLIPYVISEDEFGVNEVDNDQSYFTYYEGDDTLTDQRDEVVTDVEETIGEDNLTKFGSGGRNPNVVYVRNDKLGLDFEITRVEGKYSEVGAGFIRHSQDRHVQRRFRGVDE